MAGFDIMSIFSGQSTQAPAPAPAVTQNTPKPSGGDGNPDAFNQSDNQDPKVVSPMDKHAELFKNDPKTDVPAFDPNAAIFTMDPAKMQEEVSKMDFTSQPEVAALMQKGMGGDTAAMLQAMNLVAQQSFLHAAQLTAASSERAAKTGIERVMKELPNTMRDIGASDALAEINPIFKHEAMQPVVEGIRRQYQRKHPDASSKDIAKLTASYFADVSKQLGSSSDSTKPTDHRTVAGQNDDFADFFGFGPGKS